MGAMAKYFTCYSNSLGFDEINGVRFLKDISVPLLRVNYRYDHCI